MAKKYKIEWTKIKIPDTTGITVEHVVKNALNTREAFGDIYVHGVCYGYGYGNLTDIIYYDILAEEIAELYQAVDPHCENRVLFNIICHDE